MKPIAEKITKQPLRICDCGISNYQEILALQHQLSGKRRQAQIPNTVLITEHRPVITLGARQTANKLLASREALARKQIDVVDIRRGGGTTAHNPGQLVFYPIMNLHQLDLGIGEYIKELQEIGAELLQRSGLTSQTKKGLPGLWVGEKKIASIGVRVSKQVTYHGMAINIKNDLSIFEYIIPCGLEDVEMTSLLKETGTGRSMNRVKKDLAGLLVNHFSSRELLEYEICR